MLAFDFRTPISDTAVQMADHLLPASHLHRHLQSLAKHRQLGISSCRKLDINVGPPSKAIHLLSCIQKCLWYTLVAAKMR
jgi:hypothetical protein